jgi:cytoskeletal protein RodZ
MSDMVVWIAVMAVALALALTVWLVLVFRSEKHEPRQMHDSVPGREVDGGRFEARGGRQQMPDPREPLEPEREQESNK